MLLYFTHRKQWQQTLSKLCMLQYTHIHAAKSHKSCSMWLNCSCSCLLLGWNRCRCLFGVGARCIGSLKSSDGRNKWCSGVWREQHSMRTYCILDETAAVLCWREQVHLWMCCVCVGEKVYKKTCSVCLKLLGSRGCNSQFFGVSKCRDVVWCNQQNPHRFRPHVDFFSFLIWGSKDRGFCVFVSPLWKFCMLWLFVL